jgi:hypothetical protein
MSARRTRSLLAWMLAALVSGVAGACIISPKSVVGPCKEDIDCPDADNNPCTKEICNKSDGFCEHEPQDLPFGDKGCDDDNPCTDEVCDNGACAYLPSSTSPNDGNECTTDKCVEGVAKYTPVADGTACGVGIECKGGKCYCGSAAECGISTECLKFECTNNECRSTIAEKGTEVNGKDKGDCLKNVCDGTSAVVTVPDTDDPPDDPTTGNCRKKGCDDQGTVIDIDDPSDAPPSDSNECTREGCNGGTLINENEPNGKECGAGPSCGPTAGGGFEAIPYDVCVDGTCAKQPAMPCGLFKCDATNTACLTVCQNDAACIAGTYCDIADNTCKPVAGTGNPCNNGGECGSGNCVDGVCCNTACNGLCEVCNDPASKGLCIGVASGTDPANECAGGEACNGLGACAKPQAATCAVNADCLSGICEDLVCCDVECAGACERCDLGAGKGTCGFVPQNMQVSGCTGSQACDGNGGCKNVVGQPCGSNGECLSGFCQDGYCCNSACAGTCARCDQPGKVGICTNLTAGYQVGGCNGTMACDGMNGCKKVNGQTCAANGECASGFCTDGFCCNVQCNGLCQACAATKTMGVNGTCSNITDKIDPDDECFGAGCNTNNGNGCCNGAGACYP